MTIVTSQKIFKVLKKKHIENLCIVYCQKIFNGLKKKLKIYILFIYLIFNSYTFI